MSFLSTLAGAFLNGVKAPEADVIVRHSSEFPSFEEQMARIQRRDHGPWRMASVDDALSSPAIFAAVALATNTVATLSLEAYRNGVRLEGESTPRIVQRPDPFSTLRSFLQRTVFYHMTRGEFWWWIAKRDPLDNSPMSVIPVPPWEITVEENPSNRLRPFIRWGDTLMPNENMRHVMYLPGANGRGIGPLQKCGAAISVAVESEQWAADFFSGSIPSIIGSTTEDLSADEMELLDAQWMEKPPNLPRWVTNGITMSESPFSPEKAQLRDVRDANVGDAARMFNIPGALLEYQMSGSSLTYRNDETIWTDFQRRCLSPHYLEPMEQEMSDLLTRSTVARFNLDQLLRASAKERAEINAINISSGVYDAQYAQRREGIIPGAVDFAPVPQALPQAIPSRLPNDTGGVIDLTRGRSSMEDLRCPKCSWLAGRVSGPAEIKCRRCGTLAVAS